MTLRGDWWYSERRRSVLDRLVVDEGLTADHAEALAAAWEAETHTPAERVSPYFWRDAMRWIRDRLAAGNAHARP